MIRRVARGAVLVGVDGSRGSERALAWAASYARAQRRPLAVLHAVSVPVLRNDRDTGGPDRPGEAMLVSGRRLVDEAVSTVLGAAPDVPVDVHVLMGDPRSVLVGLAEHASMLVVGSRGRGPVTSLLLGSVSVALAAVAPCPVTVVRPKDGDGNDQRPVVVGLDAAQLSGGRDGLRLAPDTAGPLTFAIELASAQERPLAVLHAVGNLFVFPYLDVSGAELVQDSLAASEQLLTECLLDHAEKYPDVAVRSRCVIESPARALVAASAHAATVVVGCRGRGPARSRLLGSVSRSVVELAHSTVVVVRDVTT